MTLLGHERERGGVNNWENIPRQTNISIRDQTLLHGPRWWEERASWQNIQNLVQLWPGVCSVRVALLGLELDINDLQTISSEKGDKKVVSSD